ncbi:MAG: hypothetical protein AAF211_30180 [Myxococcota bacterium]
MKITPLLAMLPLAALTNACATQAVDDSLSVTVDLTVEDVDLSCTTNSSDLEDPDDKERQTGLVESQNLFARGTGTCTALAYYRGSILNFDELEADLPEGVENPEWTSIEVEVNGLTIDFEGVPEMPAGTYYEFGALVGTEDDISRFESQSYGYANDEGAGVRVARIAHADYDTGTRDRGTLYAGYTLPEGFATPVPVGLIVDFAEAKINAANARGSDLTALFNDAYANDAEDLYVFAGGGIAIDPAVLPAEPSDLTFTLDMDIAYEANVDVNFLRAARGAN